MAVNGLKYCGDYMFSGHTTMLTLLSLFIDECKYYIHYLPLFIVLYCYLPADEI